MVVRKNPVSTPSSSVRRPPAGDASTQGVKEGAKAQEAAKVERAGAALADLHVPELSEHVQSEAPSQATVAKDQASVFDLRLGKAQVKRVWNRLQGLLGVGDPGSLNRATDIVGQTRAEEAKLQGLSKEQFASEGPARFAALKSDVHEATQDARAKLSGARKELRALEKKMDPSADAKREEVNKLKKDVDRAEFEAMDKLMPQVFALSSEASHRTLGMRPYDVQLQAGALLQRGKAVEQYTGEGKTLSAIAPAVLGALNGRGVHIATSSNYLAKRDAAEMAPAYNALGLSVSALLPDGRALLYAPGKPAEEIDRKAAYRADVTYATAAQLGFDHLRDNLASSPETKVQRTHATLIMDEVDSLLIDDARTPLIISGRPGETHADVRGALSELVDSLDVGKHIEFDRSENWAALSDEGYDEVMERLGFTEVEQMQDPDLARMLDAAIRARVLFINGIDYIVKDEKVELIGKNGEILPGRRLSAGLHQAIEAREGVEVQAETRTIGSITLRDYLAKYDRVGGMTGTAEVSEGIFEDVYNLDVVRVPTHRPLLRKDEPTRLFATIEDKAMAIVDDALAESKAGRPVLIGCPDERSVEALSLLFQEKGIDHACLTAQNDEAEAKVIADAGRPGAITISTPKGGRGVDFKLGGKNGTPGDKQAVVDAGGLMVLGFSHNSSARIDNQLRGRAGRQGEPGSTRFYASLQDRFFMQKELPKWVTERPPGPEGMSGRQVTGLVDDHSGLGESLMQAQLKDSLPYDGVIGQHRERWVKQRDAVFRGDIAEGVHGIMEEAMLHRLGEVIDQHGTSKEGLFETYKALAWVLPVEQRDSAPPSWEGKKPKALKEHIVVQIHEALEKHIESLGEPGQKALRQVLLQALDDGYSDHLEELDSIRAGVGWQAIAEKDPKQQFVFFAHDAWNDFMGGTKDVVTRAVLGSMPPVKMD
jgi:preprotein translocase subunit SecA